MQSENPSRSGCDSAEIASTVDRPVNHVDSVRPLKSSGLSTGRGRAKLALSLPLTATRKLAYSSRYTTSLTVSSQTIVQSCATQRPRPRGGQRFVGLPSHSNYASLRGQGVRMTFRCVQPEREWIWRFWTTRGRYRSLLSRFFQGSGLLMMADSCKRSTILTDVIDDPAFSSRSSQCAASGTKYV